MNTLQNNMKFKKLIKLQKEAGLVPANKLGGLEFWTKDVTQEDFDAFIEKESEYAKRWIEIFNEMDSPLKG